jgi:hypothetical protein
MAKRFKHHFHKGKPSVAILGGLAVGPAAVVLGFGSYNTPIWQYSGNRMTEFFDRLSIAYTGYKPSDGSHFTTQQGGYVGTIGAVAGVATHWLANISGLNRYLARTRMPFRI